VTRVKEALLVKNSSEIIYRIRRKDGEYRYVLDRSFVSRDKNGKAIRSLGSLSDITTKIHAEQVLIENERRYKTLFEFSPTGLMLQDAKGTIVNVNNALASITGYSADELIGKKVTMLAAPDERPDIPGHIKDILSGKVLEHQVKNIRKDGTEVIVELRERKISLPDGSDGVLVVAHDVTARLREEQERKEQFKRLQAIYFLTDAVNRAQELETIYQEALHALTRTLRADRSSILLYDQDGVMRFKAWVGLSEEYRKQVEGHSPWKREDKEPLPILVPDVKKEPGLASFHSLFEQEHIRSVGFIPLVHQNTLLGKFMVYFSEHHLFTESEAQLMLTIAGHIAYAIERKRAERRIAESEERYRTLAEAAHDAIFIINRDDTIVYANSFAARMFNLKNEEMIGQPRMSMFPPEISERQKKVLGNIFETGIPVQSENSFPVNGELQWHDTFLVPIKNEKGAIVSVLGISRNITERKNTEVALRKSSEQQSLVLSSLPMVFYTTQAKESMPTTWISEKVKEITGFSPEEFIRDPLFWQSRIHPDDLQRAVREYESVLGVGTIHTEYRWKCADGTYHWFADQTVLHRGSDGAPHEIIGIWLDVTNQKRAEEALRESEAKWRTLMENSPGLVHMIDRDGKILYINRATVGFDRDKVIGSTIYDYVTPETADLMRENLETVFEEKHSVWFEVPAAGPYGSEAWYTCIIGPIIKDGKVISAIMDSVDITDHKRRERVQDAVYRIAQIADRSQTLDELFKAVHIIIQEVMRANNFYIALYDKAKDLLTFPYFVDEIDMPSPPSSPGKGMTAYVLRTGKPLLCGIGLFNELVSKGEIELVGVPSPVWLGVPLIVDNKTIGVMAAQDYHDENAYGEQELHVLEYISSQIAMAIQRKQAVEAIQKSEERYRLLFEESKDCIYITSADGKIIDINPAGVELFGFTSKEELLHVDVSQDLYWDPRQREEESRLVRRQGYVQDFELELRRKDGTKLIVLDTATTVRNEQGIVVGYRGIMRDMTERKKAEEALRQSETK
ncbi:MAG: PAS domain S-box protein, partial [Bacteroidetes bacterium]